MWKNIAQFEFISWILSQCASLVEVRELLDRINIVNTLSVNNCH